MVDGGGARIILATLVTSAAVRENGPMLDLVRWLRFRWRLRPKQATGDKAYATLENIKGLEDDGIRAYLPLPNWSRRPGYYGREEFTYLPERESTAVLRDRNSRGGRPVGGQRSLLQGCPRGVSGLSGDVRLHQQS